MLRAVVQGADDHAGLRAVSALGAELSAAASCAEPAPRQPACLHHPTCQRSTARGGLILSIIYILQFTTQHNGLEYLWR